MHHYQTSCFKKEKNQNHAGFGFNNIQSKKKPTYSSTASRHQPHGTNELG